MTGTALITGASSGIGAEFARQLAARGANIVLVARDRKTLVQLGAELSGRYGVAHEIIGADLTKSAHVKRVMERLDDPEHPIDVLVNNAGFGVQQNFVHREIADDQRHLAIHVETPMRLAHEALRLMIARGRGRIINVASLAAFIPWDTHGAAMAWQVSFSRWANLKYGDQGVSVTAVCPGFVRTAFHERMGIAAGREGVPDFLWLEASHVVGSALRDSARRAAVSVPSLRYKVIYQLARVLPASLLWRVMRTTPEGTP